MAEGKVRGGVEVKMNVRRMKVSRKMGAARANLDFGYDFACAGFREKSSRND